MARLAVGWVVLLLLQLGVARAQETDGAPDATSATPGGQASAAPPSPGGALSAPDLVRLHGGGMVRGTIAEFVPGERVVIVTVTGETRTFAMDQVRYAGPADEEPEAAPPPPEEPEPPQEERADERRPLVTVHAEEVRLRLVSEQPEVTFHVPTASAQRIGSAGLETDEARGYERICTAPCEASLPSGTYRLALSSEDGPTVEIDEPLHIDGDAILSGTYVSRAGLRAVGVVLMIVGAAAGLGLMLVDTELLPASAGLLLGGTALGAIFILQEDSARIDMQPM